MVRRGAVELGQRRRGGEGGQLRVGGQAPGHPDRIVLGGAGEGRHGVGGALRVHLRDGEIGGGFRQRRIGRQRARETGGRRVPLPGAGQGPGGGVLEQGLQPRPREGERLRSLTVRLGLHGDGRGGGLRADADEELRVGQVDRDARADLLAPDREAAVEHHQLEAQVRPGDRRTLEPEAKGGLGFRGRRRRRQHDRQPDEPGAGVRNSTEPVAFGLAAACLATCWGAFK